MKKDFDIKYRSKIESGKCKVETKDGHAVDIIGFEYNHCKYPILAVVHKDGNDISIWYNNDGKYEPHGAEVYSYDLELVVITDEPELTEFQSAIYKLLKGHGTDYSDDLKSIRDISEILFNLAEEEISSRKIKKNVCSDVISEHNHYPFPNIPKWKKMTNGAMGGGFRSYLVRNGFGNYKFSSSVVSGDEYILLCELENLPKDWRD